MTLCNKSKSKGECEWFTYHANNKQKINKTRQTSKTDCRFFIFQDLIRASITHTQLIFSDSVLVRKIKNFLYNVLNSLENFNQFKVPFAWCIIGEK